MCNKQNKSVGSFPNTGGLQRMPLIPSFKERSHRTCNPPKQGLNWSTGPPIQPSLASLILSGPESVKSSLGVESGDMLVSCCWCCHIYNVAGVVRVLVLSRMNISFNVDK